MMPDDLYVFWCDVDWWDEPIEWSPEPSGILTRAVIGASTGSLWEGGSLKVVPAAPRVGLSAPTDHGPSAHNRYEYEYRGVVTQVRDSVLEDIHPSRLFVIDVGFPMLYLVVKDGYPDDPRNYDPAEADALRVGDWVEGTTALQLYAWTDTLSDGTAHQLSATGDPIDPADVGADWEILDAMVWHRYPHIDDPASLDGAIWPMEWLAPADAAALDTEWGDSDCLLRLRRTE
jgi:hypothetical protein